MKHRSAILLWAPHLALLALLAAEYDLARAAEFTQEELTVLLDEGTGRQKAWAMHVLANRDDPSGGQIGRAHV